MPHLATRLSNTARSPQAGIAKPRGYILLETVISGIIVATAIVGLLGQLSSARVAGIATAREQTASRLAAGELESARARAPSIVPGTLRNEKVAVGTGRYKVVTTASPIERDEMPARGSLVLKPQFIKVQTDVSFEVGNRVRRVTASTRLYR